jgi:hypothetical protein
VRIGLNGFRKLVENVQRLVQPAALVARRSSPPGAAWAGERSLQIRHNPVILKTLPSFQIARLTERPSTLDEWARAVLRLLDAMADRHAARPPLTRSRAARRTGDGTVWAVLVRPDGSEGSGGTGFIATHGKLRGEGTGGDARMMRGRLIFN